MNRRLAWGVAAIAAGIAGLAVTRPLGSGTLGVWAPSNPTTDGLVTNSYAHWNPGRGVDSAEWIATSGSLFGERGQFVPGRIDGDSPDSGSSGATESAVFRVISQRSDFVSYVFDLDLRVRGFAETTRTPRRDWDGVHLFVHYLSADETYTIDLCRRDGQLTIKRKLGADPASAYTTLAEAGHACNVGELVHATAQVVTRPTSVSIVLLLDGKEVLRAADAEPQRLARAGRVGVRADNADFAFANVRVRPYGHR